jgi:4-amino-4-deoxy-L-arabinose transferase-like glycosyltransferase
LTSGANRFLRVWLLVAVAALAVHLGSVPLFDADEGRNGEVGREMAATNDYVMPRIDGMPYLDKPIVYFAAEAAAMEVLGPTELAARLPAYLFTLLTAAVVFWWARRRWDEESAYVAAICYLAMPLTLAFARTVIFDSALSFFVVVAVVAFFEAIVSASAQCTGGSAQCTVHSAQAAAPPVSAEDASAAGVSGVSSPQLPTRQLCTVHCALCTRHRALCTPIAWSAIALGVLTKGPVAIAIPLLIAIPYAVKRKAFRALWSWTGLILFVAIIAPWVYAVSRVVPDFLHYVLVTETAQRLATKALKRTGPPWYFIPYVIGGALPWSIAALFAWRRERRDDALLYVAFWIVIPFVFFSISQSKRPQYILPVMPAIALAVAHFWTDERRATAVRVAAAVFAILGLALVAAPFVHVKKMSAEVAAGIQSSALPMGVVALAAAVAALVFAKRRELALAALSLPILAIPITANPLLQSIGARRSAKALVAQMKPRIGNAAVVGMTDYTGSLQFYLQRPIEVVTPNAEEFTSNYIIRHYDAFANDPRWPVRRELALDPRRVYVLRVNDVDDQRMIAGSGFREIARDAHHVAFAAPNTIR